MFAKLLLAKHFPFSEAMEECPVCLQPFGLDKLIPKSLDCRHAVCVQCVMNPGLRSCPICRQNIIKRSALPNDFSIMAYLESNSRKQYLKERRVKVQKLIDQVLEASEDVDRRLKEETTVAAQTVKNRSNIFNSYIKQLFEECQQRCSSERLLTDAISNKIGELEITKQQLESFTHACMSLLDNPDVTTDEIEMCETKALNVVENAKGNAKSRASDLAMWNSYRQMVMETLAEISKVPPRDRTIIDTGNSYPQRWK